MRKTTRSGLKSVKQVSRITGVHIETLNRWRREKPNLYDIVLLGCKQTLETKQIKVRLSY